MWVSARKISSVQISDTFIGPTLLLCFMIRIPSRKPTWYIIYGVRFLIWLNLKLKRLILTFQYTRKNLQLQKINKINLSMEAECDFINNFVTLFSRLATDQILKYLSTSRTHSICTMQYMNTLLTFCFKIARNPRSYLDHVWCWSITVKRANWTLGLLFQK